MAGTLVLDTLQNGAGTASTSADNVINGCAKAWATFSGTTGSTVASYNISSTTRTGTGLYTVNFTNALTDANYSTQSNCRESAGLANFISVANGTTPTTTSVSFRAADANGTATDVNTVYIAVFR